MPPAAPDWLPRLLEGLGYRVPPHARPLEAYVDRYGEPRYVFEVDYGGGPRRVELIEDDLRALLWKVEPPRPDPMEDPELARLTPSRGAFGELWDKSVHPAVLAPLRRAALRRAASWYLPETAPDWLKARVGGEGGRPGLSNGAKRAATASEAILYPPKAWLNATFEYRPGTLHVKVSGKLTPIPTQAKRGEIRRISAASARNLLGLLRELEAQERFPEIMVTATYPGDWQGALGVDKGFLANYKAALKKLAYWTRLMAGVKKKAASEGWHERFDLIYENYLEALDKVGRMAKELMNRLPDGRLVKRHLDAFLKRFDRAFGHRVLAVLPDREAAEALAEHYREKGTYPMVKVLKRKKGGFEVVAVLYRVLWWMEFQRRGAPHLHFLFFDVVDLDFDAVRRWAGPAWAGVVWGLRNLNRYLAAEVGHAYDTLRALWGKEAGEAFFAEWLAARGLSLEVWKHLRAGTRVERMRKRTWGYAAREVAGGRPKAYQRRVPKLFRNVGRWWGYRNYRRQKPRVVRLPMADPRAHELLAEALRTAERLMPKAAFKFRQKLERARKAIADGEPYAYLTIWGQAGGLAMAGVEKALMA